MIKKLKNHFEDKRMENLQKKIDNREPVSILIKEIENEDTHKNPLEFINILFSIMESLLKKILDNNKPCHKNIRQYQRENRDTIINIQQVQRAIDVRNNTSHASLIRNPIKTDFTINTYIKYINIIAYEKNVDLKTFVHLPKKELEPSTQKKPLSIMKKVFIVGSLLILFFSYFLYFNKTINPKLLTGSSTGTYYLIAQNIKESIAPDLIVKKTEGSITNMEKIASSQESDKPILTFVQNDVLQKLAKEAHSGDSKKQEILNKTKVLMPIYNEEIHILVQEKNSNIQNFRDLKDKKISIGMQNSGTAISAKSLYFKLFHEEIDFKYLAYDKALKALKDKSIDAIVLTGGQPLSKLNRNVNGIRLISYEGEPLDGYSIGYIEKNAYPWLKKEKIRTLSVKSFIVTNIGSNKENLKYLKSFIQKLKDFKVNLRQEKYLKNIHPKLKDLAKQRCLPTLPLGLEYHQFVKWDTPWCKK